MFDISELPSFVIKAGKSFLVIAIGGWDGSSELKVTLDDVARYYAYEARSISGGRSLAGHFGDWRPIDELASFCLDYFKEVNINGMRKVSKRYGLEPKF